MTLDDSPPEGSHAAPPLLEAFELTKRGPEGFLALDAVSLTVHPGEIYCLLGAAGAGKTLLIHVCLGLVKPTAGRAIVSGMDVAREPLAARRQTTYIPRGAVLYPSLTARENVQFFAEVDGRVNAVSRSDCYNAMRMAGMPERHFERMSAQLGPAVTLLAWLAISLMKNTPVLLFDEPTLRLDLYATSDVQEILHELRSRGKAILIATADVLLAGAIADRIGILQEGRKRVELSRRELVGRSLPELYLEYLGRPLVSRRRAGHP